MWASCFLIFLVSIGSVFWLKEYMWHRYVEKEFGFCIYRNINLYISLCAEIFLPHTLLTMGWCWPICKFLRSYLLVIHWCRDEKSKENDTLYDMTYYLKLLLLCLATWLDNTTLLLWIWPTSDYVTTDDLHCIHLIHLSLSWISILVIFKSCYWHGQRFYYLLCVSYLFHPDVNILCFPTSFLRSDNADDIKADIGRCWRGIV